MTSSARRSLRWGSALFVIAITPFLLATEVTGKQGKEHKPRKLDAVLRNADHHGSDTIPVIVTVERSARREVRKLLKELGYNARREHSVVSALSADVRAEDLDKISDLPGVLAVSYDATVMSDSVSFTSGTVMRDTLGVPSTGVKGYGVGVAVIDTGIAPHSDFGSRIKAFYDFTRGGVATKPYDDNGHGTHVAGLIGGNGESSLAGTYAGVATKVSLVGLKVLKADGSGSTSDVIAAIEFAIANKRTLGIDIINLSLGHPPFESATTDPLVAAVQEATAAGILVVTSAGNYGVNPLTGLPGYGGISVPGNSPSALTVGSERTEGTRRHSDDTVGTYSSRGPTWFDGYAKPDIVAPGHRLIAPAALGSALVLTYPTQVVKSVLSLLTSGSSNYLVLSGTSMAAAVTSGVAALVIEANRSAFPAYADRPGLTPNAIKAILQYTAVEVRDENGVEYDALTVGAGALNALGAVKLAKAIDTGLPVGSYWLAGSVTPFDTIAQEVLPWSQNVIWGDNVVWGDAVVQESPRLGEQRRLGRQHRVGREHRLG